MQVNSRILRTAEANVFSYVQITNLIKYEFYGRNISSQRNA